jgi:predicted transglutaminase-like cysteine proteinase
MISITFPIIIFSASTTLAAAHNKAFLYAKSATTAPPGAHRLCTRYKWACTRSGKPQVNSTVALEIAKLVNNQVNRQTRQIEDQLQYGKEKYWALPSSRGGDCEDIVLLKKTRLMNNGLSSNDLLIATVLDLNRKSHAVLVLRAKRGDYVLDSYRNRIVRWYNTGYTFLKMQNPKSPCRWNAILAGGLIKDTPTGSN